MGTKDDLIFKPKTAFVKRFFGIKGFKETLDEKILTNAYEEILAGKKKPEDIIYDLYK